MERAELDLSQLKAKIEALRNEAKQCDSVSEFVKCSKLQRQINKLEGDAQKLQGQLEQLKLQKSSPLPENQEHSEASHLLSAAGKSNILAAGDSRGGQLAADSKLQQSLSAEISRLTNYQSLLHKLWIASPILVYMCLSALEVPFPHSLQQIHPLDKVLVHEAGGKLLLNKFVYIFLVCTRVVSCVQRLTKK